MKTFSNLTSNEKHLYSQKSALNYNSQILADMVKFVLTKISDPEVIKSINALLESLIENFDQSISKHLSDENNNKKVAN